MMGSGQKRGWVIIGMDLLIVLGIYFIYSNFAFDTTEVNETTLKERFTYSLSVKEASNDTLPVRFSMSNKSDRDLTSDFPNGVLVLLTDGAQTRYWSTVLMGSTSVSLRPGESRSWNLTADRPGDASSPVFVEVFMDETRQLRVEVPP